MCLSSWKLKVLTPFFSPHFLSLHCQLLKIKAAMSEKEEICQQSRYSSNSKYGLFLTHILPLLLITGSGTVCRLWPGPTWYDHPSWVIRSQVDNLMYRWEWTPDTLRTHWDQITQKHSEVVWATGGHIRLAEGKAIHPGPHWRTAYSTDVFCVMT